MPEMWVYKRLSDGMTSWPIVFWGPCDNFAKARSVAFLVYSKVKTSILSNDYIIL